MTLRKMYNLVIISSWKLLVLSVGIGTTNLMFSSHSKRNDTAWTNTIDLARPLAITTHHAIPATLTQCQVLFLTQRCIMPSNNLYNGLETRNARTSVFLRTINAVFSTIVQLQRNNAPVTMRIVVALVEWMINDICYISSHSACAPLNNKNKKSFHTCVLKTMTPPVLF